MILARRTANLKAFEVGPVHALSSAPAWRRGWTRVVEKARGYAPQHVQAAQAEGVRLLHAHFGPVAAQGVALAERLNVPLIASFYGFDLGRHRHGRAGLRKAYAQLFERGAAFVVEGPVAGRRLLDLGCPEARLIVHRLGVDPERIPFRVRCRKSTEPLRVLMAARFTEKKGLVYGLEAIRAVDAAGAKVCATIVGAPGRGRAEREIERKLHAIVDHAGLGDRVRFTGRVPPAQLRRLLYEHDVILQPSVEAADGDCEGGLPVNLIEAAASGLALIGSRHSDIPEIVRPGVTGWLCEERDVAGLAAALSEACNDPELVARLGRGARQLVEADYDVRRHTLDEVYRRALL